MKLLVLISALVAAVWAAPGAMVVPRDDSRDNSKIPAIDDKEFISTVLNAHWYWRRIHCAQDLQWNATLAEMAKKDIRTCTKNLEHMISADAKEMCFNMLIP